MGNAIYTKAEREQMAKNGHAKQKHSNNDARAKLEPHPLSLIFPVMRGPEFEALCVSIESQGQIEPIVLLEGKILDGRNRWQACHLTGKTPITREFGSRESDGGDPRSFVIAENVRRRHLNETQRSVVASRLATLPSHRPGKSENFPTLTQEEAAALLGVSDRSVRHARKALDSGSQELETLVETGAIPVSKASAIADRADLAEIGRRMAGRLANGEQPRKALKAVLHELVHGAPTESAPAIAERALKQTSGRGKPTWLMRALVRHYSRTGQLVCDPFAGYGGTLRAARDEGRHSIGAEIDAAVVAATEDADIRVGDWRHALADIASVDAIICDPPYSERTHAAATTRGDDSHESGLTPTYAAWTPEHVAEFVAAWSPRCAGWMVALTDSELIPAWRDAYRTAGRYAFAPVPVVIKGMSVRISGDGPSSWCVYAMVARPATEEFVKWGTLPGAYFGTKTRDLMEAVGVDEAGNGE